MGYLDPSIREPSTKIFGVLQRLGAWGYVAGWGNKV